MLLEFKNTDFEHVKQTINDMIMYIICLRNVIEQDNKSKNQEIEIPEKRFLLSLQAMVKGDEKVYDTFLDELYEKAVQDNSTKELQQFFYHFNMLSLFMTMEDDGAFSTAVSSKLNLINEDGEIKTTYLYIDKNTVQEDKMKILYFNRLSFIYDLENKIINKTKKIANECINESLKKYYNIAKTTKSFAEKFAKSKENKNE